jgi:hypothetical protein
LHQPFVVPGQNLLFARLPASIGIEGVIKELDYEFGLPRLCCKKFWETEAALSLAVLTYNLNILFQRHLGWMERVNVATLRYRLFQNAGLISLAQGLSTLKNRHRSPKSSVVAPIMWLS